MLAPEPLSFCSMSPLARRSSLISSALRRASGLNCSSWSLSSASCWISQGERLEKLIAQPAAVSSPSASIPTVRRDMVRALLLRCGAFTLTWPSESVKQSWLGPLSPLSPLRLLGPLSRLLNRLNRPNGPNGGAEEDTAGLPSQRQLLQPL